MKNHELQLGLARLFKRHRFGIKMGLNVEQALLDLLGNPEKEFAVIHVAGTNGKGSTSAIICSILTAAGYKVGLYTSPHLVTFNERFKVDGISVTDEDLGQLVDLIESVAEEVVSIIEQEPTFFECATAMAFEHFKRCNVDVAVIETGMGGRLDATNVVDPVVSVITCISLEHTQYLGDNLAAIAFEKAGIVKHGRPIVVGVMPAEALEVIKRTAKDRECLCVDSVECTSIYARSTNLTGQKVVVDTKEYNSGVVNFPLLGKFQRDNLATAISVIDILRNIGKFNIDDDSIKKGIATTVWSGRCQMIKQDPPTIVDGAHNPDAAKALVDTLNDNINGRSVGLIVGMCGDKNPQEFLRYFSRIAKKVWIVSIDNERNMPAKMIINAAIAMGMSPVEMALPASMQEAEQWAKAKNGVVCITGSLFLVGEVLSFRQ